MKIKIKIIPDEGPLEVYELNSYVEAIQFFINKDDNSPDESIKLEVKSESVENKIPIRIVETGFEPDPLPTKKPGFLERLFS